MNNNNDINITMIGPLPPPYGGTTVYFEILQEEVRQQPGIHLQVINTTAIAKSRGMERIHRLLHILAAAWSRPSPHRVISVHMSIGALAVFAPWFVVVGKLNGTPVIIHRFGGDLIASQPWWRSMALWFGYRRCSAALVETRAQMAELAAVKFRTMWFPNIRKPPATPPELKSRCQKFLYLSQIFPEKGVAELLVAFSGLRQAGSDATLSIYGPILKDSFHESDFAQPGVSYHGVVKPEDIYRVIAEHDALILPSYYKGEGYPGIIIEAFHMGLPVIATQWQSIPDIVDESCGLLVPPKDVTSLQEAMATLENNEVLYSKLASGALKQAHQFSTETAVENYLGLCKKLVRESA
ncbi:MAG TPA: glycosyltransferase [Gammaproteobacteria bacterium]|nr:glycosyltransferase [Gammaproteobacteria bacterium]